MTKTPPTLNIKVSGIEEIKPEIQKNTQATEKMVNFLESMKGDKGDKGDTGEKGDTGDIGPMGPQGESIQGEKGDKGDTGEMGPMGPTGKSGKDGIDGTDGKDGKNGKDGSPDTPKDIKDKLETLKGKKRLNVSAIEGIEKIQKEIDHIASFGSSVQEYRVEGVKKAANASVLNFKATTGITLSGVPTSDGMDITIGSPDAGGDVVGPASSTDNNIALFDGVTGKLIKDGGVSLTGINHNTLSNLTVGDVHTQYAYLAGRSGGQSLTGGTASGNNLTLLSTSHATKGKIFLGTASAYDEVNNWLGIGTTAPITALDARGISNNTFTNNPIMTSYYSTDTFGINKGAGLNFGGKYNAAGDLTTYGYIGALKENATDGNYSGKLVFGTRLNGAGNADMTRMTILSSGNVGIGIAAPTQKLHVVGTGYVSSFFGVGAIASGSYNFEVTGSSFFSSTTYFRSVVYYYNGSTNYFGIQAISTTNKIFTTSSSVNKDIVIQNGDIATALFSNSASVATMTLGTAGATIGVLAVSGNTSGVVSIKPQATAGTYNFNLPTSAGSSGQPLLSAGGGASPMTFGTLGVNAGGTGATSMTTNGIAYGSSTLAFTSSVNSAVLVTNGSGTPSLSTTLPDFTAGTITFADTGKNIAFGTTTGTKIGTATNQKLAFYNSTPIVQGASVADATGGVVIDAEARTAINALISRIEALGLIATV